MTSIDPLRRAADLRRTAAARRAQLGRVEKAERPEKPEDRLLPVPYEAPQAPALLAEEMSESAAAFSAQLIAQNQRRPRRQPMDILDAARTVYARTEWSGPADRRARKGSVAKTEV
jgi:hypothetical protein